MKRRQSTVMTCPCIPVCARPNEFVQQEILLVNHSSIYMAKSDQLHDIPLMFLFFSHLPKVKLHRETRLTTPMVPMPLNELLMKGTLTDYI